MLKSQHLMILIGAVFAASCSQGGDTKSDEIIFLTNSEITAAVSGKDMGGCYREDYGTDQWKERLAADGKLYDLKGETPTLTGTWSATDDKFCFHYEPDGPTPNDPCFQVRRVKDGYVFYVPGEDRPLAASFCPFPADV